MQPYSNPTRRNMEDNLNIFENGRRPQFFWKRKTISICFETWRRPTKKKCNHKQLFNLMFQSSSHKPITYCLFLSLTFKRYLEMHQRILLQIKLFQNKILNYLNAAYTFCSAWSSRHEKKWKLSAETFLGNLKFPQIESFKFPQLCMVCYFY